MIKQSTTEFLKGFKHGSRTDLRKGRLTNADAIAIMLTQNGPMTFREISQAVFDWRQESRENTYLFNKSDSGGYGFCGDSFYSRGVFMNADGHWSGKAHRQVPVKGENFYRRHFWYRIRKGTYAPTLEGFLRGAELLSPHEVPLLSTLAFAARKAHKLCAGLGAPAPGAGRSSTSRPQACARRSPSSARTAMSCSSPGGTIP